MGYTKDFAKGISWVVTLRILTRAISFLKTVILARILVPAQFGSYGIALLVVGFLEVMTETGVNVILIQEKNTYRYINSAWIVSIARGIFIALLIVASTPFISGFFNSPDSSILLYLISFVPLLRGFINPSVVKFQKELRFHTEFWYRLIVFIVDGFVAVIATVITQHPIGIIIGLISGVFVEVILSFLIVKPTPSFIIHREYIMKIIHRGKWVTASGIFNYLFHNIDKIVVGRLLGTSSLGIYQMAYSFSMLLITEISDVFSRVTFPVYAKIADDKKRLRKAFMKATVVISLLAFSLGATLYLFSKEIVLFVLGEKWVAAASILPILAMFGVVRAVSGSSSALFLAIGKQEYVTVVTLVSALGLIIPIIPFVMGHGIVGAAISALIGSIVVLPVIVYYSWVAFKDKR